MKKKNVQGRAPSTQQPRQGERSEAYKRGSAMGEDFIQGFDPDQAAEAISGFLDAVTARILSARDKATNLTVNAEAALMVLRAGATV